MRRARRRRPLGSGQRLPSGWAQLRAQFGDVPTARQRHRVKKRTEPEVAAEPSRGRGRPTGSAPAKTSRERQDEFRSRLREQGRKALRLSLPPEVIDEFDSLRVDGASREETFEVLVSAAARRRKR